MAPQKKPETRSEFITFRLTPAEFKRVSNDAAKAKLGVRAYIRTLLGLEP